MLKGYCLPMSNLWMEEDIQRKRKFIENEGT